MPYGPAPFDSPILTLEAIICEIIDNSIAAGAEHIHVEIGDDISLDGRQSLNFSVYDDGKKVPETPWAEEHIVKAFEIEYDPSNPPPRAPGEVGKFHVGMKLATLSKFDTVSMVTLSADDLVLQRHGTYPSDERRLADMENEYGGALNPSNTPPETIDIDEIVETLKSNEMTTFVGGRTPRVQLLYGGRGDREYKTNYLQHMRIFLGITYQLYLEDNDFKLTLGLWNQSVNPIDPFWKTSQQKIYGTMPMD